MYARLSTHAHTYAHILRNIASRRSEGDVCRSMSKIAQAEYRAKLA